MIPNGDRRPRRILRNYRRCAGKDRKEMNASEFWAKTDQGPTCWIWKGPTNKMGYGYCHRNKKAHRIAWELTFGPIPKGMCVCHKCDVRNCVNPSHLFLGTTADNNYDMFAKGRDRQLNGEAHGNSKLTAYQVQYIRGCAQPGNYSALGRQFGVSYEQIRRIANGKEWKHLVKVKEGK